MGISPSGTGLVGSVPKWELMWIQSSWHRAIPSGIDFSPAALGTKGTLAANVDAPCTHLTIPPILSLGILPAPDSGGIWALPPSTPPSPSKSTFPTSPTPHGSPPHHANGSVLPVAPPPPFFSSELAVHMEPLPDPPLSVTCDPALDPNRVGPSQPLVNFVDGHGYKVLRSLVADKGCEVAWGNVMKALGTGEEKVVAKSFQFLFHTRLSMEQAKDSSLLLRWQSKGGLCLSVRGPLFKKATPKLGECVLPVADLHPMVPGAVIVSSVSSGHQLDHTNMSTHPEVLPLLTRTFEDAT